VGCAMDIGAEWGFTVGAVLGFEGITGVDGPEGIGVDEGVGMSTIHILLDVS